MSCNNKIIFSSQPHQGEDYSNCSDLCSKEVLLCDDESFNITILEEMLLNEGISSACFTVGSEATECFRKRLALKCCTRTFKLVLTDISMPKMDGFELCTQIN